MLNPSSKLKGEKDMLKYEKARELKKHINRIRDQYVTDFKSKEMRLRQRAVALYFIDKLALRAGNEVRSPFIPFPFFSFIDSRLDATADRRARKPSPLRHEIRTQKQ